MTSQSATYERNRDLLGVDMEFWRREEGIIAMCPRGVIRAFNSGAENLFGYTSDEMLGTSITQLISLDSRGSQPHNIESFLSNNGESTIGCSRHVIGKCKDGSLTHLSMSFSELHLDGQSMLVAVGHELHADSTWRIRDRLNRAYQNAFLHEVMCGIGDKLNQPLTALSTYADVMRRYAEQRSATPELLMEILRKMSAQVVRSSEVIASLHDRASGFVRVGGHARIIPLFSQLNQLLRPEASTVPCSLTWQCESGLPVLRVDPIQIQHAILLLVRNSLESFPALPCSDAYVQVSASRDGLDRVRLCVEDNGCGIDEDQIDTLYHPFESTKQDHLGIGLAICQTIAFCHGGQLRHEVADGGGCRMILTLPILS